MNRFGLIFALILMGSSAFAASVNELQIASCQAQSAQLSSLKIELAVNADKVFVGRYTLKINPVYNSERVNFGSVDTPPAALSRLLAGVNQFRETGLRADQVKFFQNVFVDGSDSWDIELWKLMDGQQKTLGWVAYAYGQLMGCY